MSESIHPYDVFISYSRKSPGPCDRIKDLIELTLCLSCFRDVDDVPPGALWNKEIERQLGDSRRLSVLLIATQTAVDHSPHIVDELAFAFEKKLHIVPLDVDPGCATVLLNKAVAKANISDSERGAPLPQIFPCPDVEASGDLLEDGLRRALLGPLLEAQLGDRRRRFTAWCRIREFRRS